MEKQKKSNRKPGLFGSLTGLFCQCGSDQIENDENVVNKSRALSSDMSTSSTTAGQRREDEDDLYIKKDLYDYQPCFVTKPAMWHPFSLHEISQKNRNLNVYAWGRYHVFQGQGKFVGQKTLSLFEPPIVDHNIQNEQIQQQQQAQSYRVSLRFNKFQKTSGFGIASKGAAQINEFNLASVNKRKSKWVQSTLLNPEQEKQAQNNSQEQQQQQQTEFDYGGVFILNEKGSDKCAVLNGSKIETVQLSWKEKDQIILELNESRTILKVTVINTNNFDAKSIDIQINPSLFLTTLTKQNESTFDYSVIDSRNNSENEVENQSKLKSGSLYDDVHFAVVLDHVGDHAEILGDPDTNNVKQKMPPQLSNLHFYDLSQKYYLEGSSCSSFFKYENKSMDCVLLQTTPNAPSNQYYFAYFKPSLPFPSEKIYTKRVAFLIEEVGEGEVFIGITREAYALHNIDAETPHPEENWHGRRIIFRSKQPTNNTNGRFSSQSSFQSGCMIVLEYDPFMDQITMINSFGSKSVLKNLYSEFTPKEYSDKQNRYCFCVGGSKGLKVCLYNDYYDDIEEQVRI